MNAPASLRWILDRDRALLLRVRRTERARITVVMKALTRLGNAESWAILSLALLLLGGESSRLGIIIGCAALLATVFSHPLKRLCRRARPSSGITGFQALAENPDAFSFPSGHTCAAVAVTAALIGAGPIVLLAAVLAAGIATSRVYLGAHYPLDVAAGATLGTIAGLLVQLFVGNM